VISFACTADQIRSLEAKLQELESTDSTQVAVLIIPTLEDESLEDYSHRVASAWRPDAMLGLESRRMHRLMGRGSWLTTLTVWSTPSS